ncbi:MAG TPA: ATP-binding cassette domain-containing protein [Chitinophagales bacterium]|nr:ATP-binding cassette domain-containing protein [Chitinophagales bacterium]
MVQLLGIKKSYGSHVAAEVPAFQLEEKIYWLKGINGSGKTTLMKLIAGLLPFEGDVVLDHDITIKKKRTNYLRLVNYAEAEPLYPPFLSGTDLLQLYIQSKNATQDQAKQLIAALQVGSFIGNPTGTYSSGMLKKISLLLAFIGQPKLILLDEPLVTIDDKTVPVINHIIRDYHEQNGVTFLLTSHQLFESNAFPITHQLEMKDQTIKTLP